MPTNPYSQNVVDIQTIERGWHIVRGRSFLRRDVGIDPSKIEHYVFNAMSRESACGPLDDKIGRLLARWMFPDGDWRTEALVAIQELLDNIIKHGARGPHGGATPMGVYCQVCIGRRSQFLVVFISGVPHPIDVARMHPRVCCHLHERGRGAMIVASFTDVFAVDLVDGGVIIVKRAPRRYEPRRPI